MWSRILTSLIYAIYIYVGLRIFSCNMLTLKVWSTTSVVASTIFAVTWPLITLWYSLLSIGLFTCRLVRIIYAFIKLFSIHLYICVFSVVNVFLSLTSEDDSVNGPMGEHLKRINKKYKI